VLNKLGEGGVGLVYAATTQEGQQVAIKTLKPPFCYERVV